MVYSMKYLVAYCLLAVTGCVLVRPDLGISPTFSWLLERYLPNLDSASKRLLIYNPDTISSWRSESWEGYARKVLPFSIFLTLLFFSFRLRSTYFLFIYFPAPCWPMVVNRWCRTLQGFLSPNSCFFLVHAWSSVLKRTRGNELAYS